MRKIKAPLIILLLLPVLFQCKDKISFDAEKERQSILDMHRAQRGFHFAKDSVSFANQLSDNFISVNRGVVSKPTRDETQSRYHGYFSAVEFLLWDDVAEPIIFFSEDGSLAYSIVDKIVRVEYDSSGHKVEGETHFAWTAIHRKYGDQWKIDCVTSTERPN